MRRRRKTIKREKRESLWEEGEGETVQWQWKNELKKGNQRERKFNTEIKSRRNATKSGKIKLKLKNIPQILNFFPIYPTFNVVLYRWLVVNYFGPRKLDCFYPKILVQRFIFAIFWLKFWKFSIEFLKLKIIALMRKPMNELSQY